MTHQALEKHLAEGKPLLLRRKPLSFDGSPEAEKLKQDIRRWNTEALSLLKKTQGGETATAAFTQLGNMKYSTLTEVKDQLKARRKIIERLLKAAASPKPPEKSPVQKRPLPRQKAGSTASRYDYDVCLSFAGEDRKKVQKLHEAMAAKNIRVFYDHDADIAAELWGKDLYTYLDDIYQNKARYCVMFISRHYVRKVWTNHERQSAQSRAFMSHEEYILPVRLDDTVVPGIRPTTGFLKWSDGVNAITEAMLRKLGKSVPPQGATPKRQKAPAKTKEPGKIPPIKMSHTILLGSQLFTVQHLKHIPRQHVEVELKVKDKELQALRTMEAPSHRVKYVPFVHRLDAFDVQVSILSETTSRGTTTVTLKLLPNLSQGDSVPHRINWNGKSATELVEEQVRHLLLGKKPPAGPWSHATSSLPAELQAGILPLAQKAAHQGTPVFSMAHFLAVYHLHTQKIVDEIIELNFKPLRNGQVAVSFHGRLHASFYSEAGEVTVNEMVPFSG